jgi:hypothetical protein
MTKRKDYKAITNKIVNTSKVIARGQRVPVLELNFKPSGFTKEGGHQVYIDYKCAKEVIEKLSEQVREIESSYFPYEMFNRINKRVNEEISSGQS